MRIRSFGHACFSIKTKTATIVTDPYAPQVGFSLPSVEADIVTVSHDHPDHNAVSLVQGEPFVVAGPGEYEIKEVAITGLVSFHDNKQGEERGGNVIYTIAAEELTLCHLGDLGHKLETNVIEELGDIDVLFIPVGGVMTLDPKEAAELVKQLEPRLVIPMHYRTKFHDPKTFAQVEPVETFLKEMGVEKREEAKLVISKSSLGDELEVVVLRPKHR
jgi:L-ascorbate metabolism protein UlaG (beta-lactamase superfamily)